MITSVSVSYTHLDVYKRQLKNSVLEDFIMKKIFILENLDCANCAAKMENAISKLDDVENVSISFMTTKMVLKADEDKMDAVIAESEKIIKKIEPDVEMCIRDRRNGNWFCPSWDKRCNTFYNNWRTEHSAVQQCANGAVRRFPHLF